MKLSAYNSAHPGKTESVLSYLSMASFHMDHLAAPVPQQGKGCNLSERDRAKQQRQGTVQPSPDLLSPLINPHPQAC